jgi:hypothetical protein
MFPPFVFFASGSPFACSGVAPFAEPPQTTPHFKNNGDYMSQTDVKGTHWPLNYQCNSLQQQKMLSRLASAYSTSD